MSTPPTNPITQLLAAAGQEGDQAARDRLWAAIYDELHRLAQCQMAAEAPGRTMQPTSLVHEAYLRLIGDEAVQWANRRHFFAAAAKAMRRIRIDDARKRKRLKRGGGRQAASLDERLVAGQGLSARAVREGIHAPADGTGDPAEVLAVDEALSKLEQEDPRKAEVVMLRYFAGLTGDETAQALGLSPRTVDVEWRFAKAWLHRELTK
ncbi:MAG TPA: sigma-70 family RNA polymerase sigma factor [Phycisphaerae bacterium]|nr:sigma-70 family RNA polymerase sigma factor [Phycisphaerae bacterium]